MLRCDVTGASAATLILLFLAATNLAAGDILESDRPIPLQDIQVTATATGRLSHDVAQAVTTVDRAVIDRESPQVIPEVLRGGIGTFFQQTTPGQGSAISRGLKGSQILHLVDGMRLNNAFFRSAPNQYLALVDPYAVARTEGIRGTAATLYGADAMGVVIQLLTPESHFSGSDWSIDGSTYAAYEHADRGRILRVESAAGKQGVAISGGVTWQDYDDRRTGSERIRQSGYDSTAADGKLLFDLGDNADMMLSVQYLEQPNTPRVDELIAGFGQDEPSSELFAFRPNQREFYHARLRMTPGYSWLDSIEAHLGRQDITDDRKTRDFGSTITVDESNKSELTGLTVQFASPIDDNTRLTYGVELYQDDVSSGRRQTDSSTSISETVAGRFPDGATMDSAAAYVYAETNPGRAVTVSGGLRYSQFDIKLPRANGGNATLEPDDVSGDLHITWAVNDALRLVSNLGRGFRPPNIFDLGTLGARPGDRFNIANENLDAESVSSIDLGLKLDGSRWRAEVFGFYSDYDDKITSVATGDFTPEGRTIVRSENANELEIYGLEAGARIDLATNIELYGVLNLTRGDETNQDGEENPADRVPPLNGKLGLVYEPNHRLRVESFALFASEQDRLSQRDENDPRIDPEGTSGWATLNLNLDWRPMTSLGLGLRVENLLDKRYREHGSGIDARGRSVGLWLRAGLSR
jgi:outer membrane receptor protein involved in Fe transport